MLSLLQDKNFRWLWLGQLCSQFGDRLTQMVLVALVAERAPGSTMTLAKVLVATSLPALLMNPIAGAYVDRWDRRRTMITCDLVRAALILTLPGLALSHSGLPFYCGVFLIFGVATFFVPARLAMIPDVVAPNQLDQANALFTSSGMIGSTITLLIGALLVEWVGPARSTLFNAGSYLASALFIVPIVRSRWEPGPSCTSAKLIFSEIIDGIRQLWRHENTRRSAGLLGVLMGGAGASVVAGTVLIQQLTGTVTKDLGFLSLWLGVGMLLGSLAYGRWGANRSRRKVLALSFFGCGASLWIFVAAVMALKSPVAACLAAALLGVWIAPVGIVTNTLVHEGHPERLHGRIFGSLGVVINLSLISSMLVAGWLGERTGRGMLLSAVGVLFAASGLILLCYTATGARLKPGTAMRGEGSDG